MQLDRAHLTICFACHCWTYLPRPSADGQAAIHDTAEYFDHPYFELRRRIDGRQRRRCLRILGRLQSALGLTDLRGVRLLDIGCDTGAFLAVAAEEAGMVPVGVDVAARSVREARRRGIEAYQCTLDQAPAALTGFRAITAIDLIEHVSNPAGLLNDIRQRLQPGGVVYLETPNIQSSVYTAGRLLSVALGGKRVAAIERVFPAQHIQYFTQTGLAALGRRCGFEVAELGNRVLPWRDIAASATVRAGMEALQTLDRLTGDRILIGAVLRRSA